MPGDAAQRADRHRRRGPVSPLSPGIASAFYPPQFTPPAMIDCRPRWTGHGCRRDTFALTIPPTSSATCWRARAGQVQLNVDATRMSQAFTGSGYIQQIVTTESMSSSSVTARRAAAPVDLALRARFNPELNKTWFGG